MMSSRANHAALLTAFCLVALAVLFPHSAQAAPSTGIGAAIASSVLEIIYALLEFVQDIIVKIITGTGELIQVFANLKLSTGGQIVYTVWRVLRDFCNMAFIIALILMAFGTIFDSLDLAFLKPYSINGRGVIVGFLMAAILLNFSLAIGQAVVGASNQVTAIVLKLMPENLGHSLAGALQLAATTVNSSVVQSNQGVLVIDNVPVAGLTPEQVATVNTLGTPAAKLQFSDCIKNKQGTPAQCYTTHIAPRTPTGQVRQGFLQAVRAAAAAANLSGNLGGRAACYFLDCSIKGVTGIGASDPKIMFRLIFDKLYAVFLSGVLMISFIVVLLFMFIRIPALWILLALSPLAWTSLAFPGLRSQGYDAWWKQFWAWNLFSPAYLFMLYFGILFINNIASATASLAPENGTVPTVLGFIGNPFAYVMAGAILIGGTGLVLKASFMGGTIAGQWVGKITNLLGAGGTFGAAAPVGRFLGTITGTTAAYRGAVGGIQSKYEDLVTKPTARRQEEIEARYQRRFGDRGAEDALQQKRIREQMKKNEEGGLSVRDMKERLEGLTKKGDTKSPQYFALSQALLKEGALDAGQMKTLGESASALGGVGQNAIRQQIARKIGEQTKEKKFTGDKARDNALGAFQALSETDDGKERKKFLEDLKRNQLAVYAQLVDNAEVQGIMASKGLDVENGRPLRMEEIIENNTSKLEAEDIPALMKLASQPNSTLTLGDNFKYRRDILLNDKNNVSKMLDSADAAGKVELKARLDKLKQDTMDVEGAKAELGVLAQERLEAERENRARALAGRGTPPPSGGTPPPRGTPPTGGGSPPVPPRPAPGGGGAPPAPPAPAARPARPSARPAPTRPAPVPPSGGTPAPGAPPTATPVSVRPRPAGSPSKTSRSATGPRQIPVVVSINGTPSGTIVVESGASEGAMLQAAKGSPDISQQLQGKAIQRTSYFLGRLNITTS